MATIDAIIVVGAHPGEDLAAPAFHPADARSPRRAGFEGRVNSTLWQLRKDLVLEPQRFPQLPEAHGDPRIHVPVLMDAYARLEPVIRRQGALDTQIAHRLARISHQCVDTWAKGIDETSEKKTA